jgi:hypothetical protein
MLKIVDNIYTGGDKVKFTNKIEIKPYIGKNYLKTSTKFFILGESAYGDHEGDKDLLVNAITDIKNGKDTDYTQYPQTKMFFTKVFNILNGEGYWDNQASFWDDVCFYDYIQKIMDAPKQKIPSEYYENAEAPFFEVLKKIEPAIVIVLGIEFYKKLPSSNGEPGKNIKIRGINECIETWKYNINGKNVCVAGIQHPSSYGYKKDVWIKLYNKFLKEYEKGNI